MLGLFVVFYGLNAAEVEGIITKAHDAEMTRAQLIPLIQADTKANKAQANPVTRARAGSFSQKGILHATESLWLSPFPLTGLHHHQVVGKQRQAGDAHQGCANRGAGKTSRKMRQRWADQLNQRTKWRQSEQRKVGQKAGTIVIKLCQA